MTDCSNFNDQVQLTHQATMVKCKDTKTQKKIYENVHAVTIITEDIRAKLNQFPPGSNPPSVMIVGIDSISRLNLIRAMPKTYEYLEKHNWIGYTGYNKMDDNTFPNLMAILTGMNTSRSYDVCQPNVLGKLNECSILWYDYKKLGYVTAYAEDEAKLSTFNFLKKGFKDDPTDHYYRDYSVAFGKMKLKVLEQMDYCSGPEMSGERIFDVARDFVNTYENHSSFSLFWMNSFSHNDLNSPTRLNHKVVQFLDDITTCGVLENTIVIFLSDHGMRFGKVRETRSGWLEERLPYIYFSFPKTFQKNFPKEFANIKTNANRLTTPYDLYLTLQDILVFNNLNYTKVPSEGCPSCTSLFQEVPYERSCEDASIANHWCTCQNYQPLNAENGMVTSGAKFLVNTLNDKVASYGWKTKKCAKFVVSKIISSNISVNDKNWYKNETYLLMIVRTRPTAVFEMTIKILDSGNMTLQGGISRLDFYKSHSYCVKNSIAKMYCYCKWSMPKSVLFYSSIYDFF